MIFFQILWGIMRLICSNQELSQMCFESLRCYPNALHVVKVFFGTKPSPKIVNHNSKKTFFFNFCPPQKCEKTFFFLIFENIFF